MTPTDHTPTDSTPQDDGQLVDVDHLVAATRSLREHTDARWVQVADRVMAKALVATRRSLPIRAHPAAADTKSVGKVFVSEEVATTHVRSAIADVAGSAPNRIRIHSDVDHRCTGVTIEVTIQYPEPIIPIADEIRDRTKQILAELFGPHTPPVAIEAMHVHVSDVTTNDPHTGRAPIRSVD